MTESNFQAAQEIAKIYQSITDRKALTQFFLQSLVSYVEGDQGYMFLASKEEKLWLDVSSPQCEKAPAEIEGEAQIAYKEGKPRLHSHLIAVPMLVRGHSLGIALCQRGADKLAFEQTQLDLAFNLASALAGSLKNLLLFEENLQMERLAAVGQTVGMVVHEIKNIMQLASFANEFIRLGIDEKNDTFLNKGLMRMTKALQEMDGFIWEMLSISKDYTIEPTRICWQKILDDLKEDLAEKAEANKITLSFNVDKGFVEVDGDERALYRAVLNLVKNSIEACRVDNCQIQIRVYECEEDRYEVQVSDNGEGMSDEVKARVFEGFFSTKGTKGTGLGTMIVQRTMQMHHGTVRVESELGKGTTFFLSLPKTIAAEEEQT